MERCFLLGAGASLGYRNNYNKRRNRPPSSQEFFERGKELNILDENLFPGIVNIIEKYAEDQGEKSDDWKHDIEQVMTYSLNMNGERSHYGQLTYFIYALFQYYSNIYNPKGFDNYQKLAKHYRESPYCVISLNYDTIFEQALSARGLSPNYGYRYTRNQIPVAKLHGSINTINKMPNDYINFPDEIPGRMDQVYQTEIQNVSIVRNGQSINRPDTTYMEVDDVKEFNCRSLLSDERPDYYQIALAPPVGKNKLNNEGGENMVYKELKRIQEYAAEMLKDIDELVIIGCSIRENDDDLRTLIRENLGKNAKVTLATGDDSDKIANRIREDLPNAEINNTEKYFGAFVDTL